MSRLSVGFDDRRWARVSFDGFRSIEISKSPVFVGGPSYSKTTRMMRTTVLLASLTQSWTLTLMECLFLPWELAYGRVKVSLQGQLKATISRRATCHLHWPSGLRVAPALLLKVHYLLSENLRGRKRLLTQQQVRRDALTGIFLPMELWAEKNHNNKGNALSLLKQWHQCTHELTTIKHPLVLTRIN